MNDNSNNNPATPTAVTQQPAEVQSVKSNKKLWSVLFLVAAGVILLVVVVSLLVLGGSDNGADDYSVKPAVTNGFLNNNYANGAREIVLDYSKSGQSVGGSSTESVRTFLGASADLSSLVTHNAVDNSLDIYKTADGTSEKLTGLISCSLISKDNSVFCIEANENPDERVIVEVSVSSGAVSKRGATLKSMTNISTANNSFLASKDISGLNYIGKVNGKDAVLIEQSNVDGDPGSYAALLNEDLSLSWSTQLYDESVGSPFCVVANTSDKIACVAIVSGVQDRIVVADVNKRDAKVYDLGDNVPVLTSDGWVLSDDMGQSSTAFDLDGNKTGSSTSIKSLFPESTPLFGDDVVFASSKSLLTSSLFQSSSSVIDSLGNKVADSQIGLGGSSFTVKSTGKKYDGKPSYISLDGKTALVDFSDTSGVSVFINLETGDKILEISKEKTEAGVDMVNGIVSVSSSSAGSARQITVYLPK